MTDTMRSVYRELTNDEKIMINNIKALANQLFDYLNREPFAGRSQFCIARTKLEESVMWAVKGITR